MKTFHFLVTWQTLNHPAHKQVKVVAAIKISVEPTSFPKALPTFLLIIMGIIIMLQILMERVTARDQSMA